MSDKRDEFTKADLDSPNYRWKHRKIKLFIFSTTDYEPNKENPTSKSAEKRTETGKTVKTKYDINVRIMEDEFKNSCAPTGIDVDIDKNINISSEDLTKKLDAMKDDDNLRNFDCYFFAFFTYLDQDDKTENLLQFGDESVALNKIWETIRDVPQFQGKPKIFLIQADDLSYIYPKQCPQSAIPDRRIPIDADRLVILSKLPQAFKLDIKDGDSPPLNDQAKEGSFLVQAFLKVVGRNKQNQSNEKLDLLSLTTEINHEMKGVTKFIKTKARKDDFPYPSVGSTFTKFLYL